MRMRFKLSLKTIIILIGIVFATNIFANLPAETKEKCYCINNIWKLLTVPVDVECLDFDIKFGKPANEDAVPAGNLNIYSMEPSATIYSPQGLQYNSILMTKLYKDELNAKDLTKHVDTVNNQTVVTYTDGSGAVYAEKRVTEDLDISYYRQVKVFSKKRALFEFKFLKDESSAKLSGTKEELKYVMVMTDASGNPVTTNPTYFDMHMGEGNFIRYSATTNEVVSYNTATGRVITPDSPSVGLDVVYDSNDIIRQVWSVADGLADIVVINENKYEIRLYTPANAGTNTNGLYVPTGTAHTIWSVENPEPGQTTKVKIVELAGGISKDFLFEYNHSVENWMLTMPDNLAVISKSTSWDYSRTVKTDIKTVKTPDGQVAYKIAYVVQKYAFGERLAVEIIDPDGLNARTTNTYYTSGNGYGLIDTRSYPDGSWVKYVYDDKQRTIQEIKPFKNDPYNSPVASAKATYYSFTPVDSNDVPTIDDKRPRMVETKIRGITTEKTYYAYYKDNGEYVEVTEKCSTLNAAYGDSSNLRTTKRYYASTANAASSGRLKTVTNPDDTMATYTYEYGTYIENSTPGQSTFTLGVGAALRISVIHGTTANPNGIANKTTKKTTVHDVYGNEVMTKQYVYTGSTYELLTWTVKTYDQEHHLLNTYYSNGTEENNTWNCCNKESTTAVDGTQYTYTYDALKRMVSKTKVGTTGQVNIVTSYTYNALGKKLSATKSAGGLSLIESWEYNPAEKVTKEINQQGLANTYTYSNGINTGSVKGAVKIATLPEGYLKTTENYLDGNTREIIGNAVVAEYYDYGVNADGSTWSEIRIGINDSARFTKITTDMLGRTVKIDKSGYGGTIVSQNTYNFKNQLTKTTKTNLADTLYVYDELGNQIRTGLDINGNGTLDLASMDKISEMENTFANESSAWWKVRTNKVYATDNSDTATTVSTQKARLSAFTGNFVAETKQIDIHGNETVYATIIDSANKTVTQTVNVPNSNIDEQAIMVNRLLSSKRTKSNLTYTYAYDALERQTGVTDPRTGQSTTTYYTDGTGKIGQVYTQTDATSSTTTYDYNSTTGRLAWMQDSLNKKTYYAYNALGKVTMTWGNSTYPVEITYDNFGQKTQLKTYRDGTGWTASNWPIATIGTADITTWVYDEASGRITSKTYVDNKSTNYTYTIDGKIKTRTWARKKNDLPVITTCAYDENTGERTSIDYSDNTQSLIVTYNRIKQIKTVTDAVGIRTFTYNSKLQPITETITGLYGKVLTKNYATTGVVGRYAGININMEYSKTLGYDSYGRTNSISDGTDTFTYSFVINSDLVGNITRPNNLSTDYIYEGNRDLLVAVTNKYNSSTTISSYSYTNDSVGRWISKSRTGTAFATADAITYTYNDRSELTNANATIDANYNFLFDYDNIGNRKSYTSSESGNPVQSIYTSNNLNQYTVITNPAQSPTYDDDGNMLTDGNDWNNTWNCENRLIETYNDTVGKKLEFTYDYMGRRVEKKVYTGTSGTSWILSTHERFVYNGYKLIEKLDGANSNAILQKFFWSRDTPLSVCDVAANATYYYFTDANKNITQVVDSSENIVAKYEYSPFGTQTFATGTYAAINPFCFSSEYYDSETGLVYYNYRYYSSELGCWLSRDPIEEEGGVNLYAMVSNNPINFYDSLGYGIVVKERDRNKAIGHYLWIMPQIGKKPDPSSISNMRLYKTFEVYYDGSCTCKNPKTGAITSGNVVLSQEKIGPGGWNDDNFTPSLNYTCSGGKKITTKPTYLSNDKGCPGKNPGSYLDAPGGGIKTTFKFRVKAYCRCWCKPDRLLASRTFGWNSYTGIVP